MPLSANGVLTLCPDVPLSITCSHNNTASGSTRWRITGTTTQNCNALLSHDPPDNEACGPFIITSTSNMDSVLSSTAELVAVPETLDGAMVECLDGAGSVAESLGIITIQVVDPTPTPTFVLYSVDSEILGSLTINVTSIGAYGTGVTYSGTVVRGNGSVHTGGNMLNVSGLDYTYNHSIHIMGASNVCSGLQRNNQFSFSFNISEISIIKLSHFITCSNPALPITLTWDVDQGKRFSTDLADPLQPPVVGIPIISFVGGTVSSASPYTLSNPIVGDMYNLTVAVRNAAGVATRTNLIKVSAIDIDVGTVASQRCLSVIVRSECSEVVTSGDFSVILTYLVEACQTVTDFANSQSVTRVITTPAGVCIPVETRSIKELCYTATLKYQSTTITIQTNMELQSCLVFALTAQLGSGVTFTLNRAADNSGAVTHTTVATLGCANSAFILSRDENVLCRDGVWEINGNISCSELSFDVKLILALILTFLVTLVVGVSIGVVIVLAVIKYRRSKKITPQLTETEMIPPQPVIYEEIKPDPHTCRNLAYETFKRHVSANQ
ncbi:uncharacterized protein LOC135344395 isoform X2 [Halichondria panicea]